MVCSLCLNNPLPFRIFGIESFPSYSVLNLISFTKMQISVKIIRKNISWSHYMKLDFTIFFFFFRKAYKASEVVAQMCSVKKVVSKISQNSQKRTSGRASFLIILQGAACNFIKKETLAQVFSCEYCKIIMSTFFWNTSGDCF